jgi:tetratricopeptide (TPR) repeat protein
MAFLNLSACYINLGRLEKAEEWLRRGIVVWPEAPVFYDRMALLSRRRGEEEGASDYEQRAAALRRRHALK